MRKTISVLLLVMLACGTLNVAVWAQTLPETPANNNPQPNSEDGQHVLLLPLIVQGDGVEPISPRASLLADGQFVDGPNVGDFDVERYLSEKQSPLRPFATIFSDKASYYSVNPRVVLTVVELLYPASIAPTADSATASASLPDGATLDRLVEDLLLQLTEHFYGQLYGHNLAVEDAKAYQLPRNLLLRSGESVNFEATNNAASDALEISLAEYLGAQQWKRVAIPDREDSFVATYRRLFPESEPLDNSNQIRPPAPPPGDLVQAAATTMPLLKLPFAAGDTWRFTGGPHAYDGCSDNAFSAVDFAPVGYSGCADPIAEDRWITAPADATVNRVSCGGCNVVLEHGDGWGTRFYHVANPLVKAGERIISDQRVGNPSCAPIGIACGACTGSNSGVHQHIDLRYNGAFIAIEGAKFEEYTVRGEACYQGYLEKDGVKYYAPAKITSQPDTGIPTATVTISGTLYNNNSAGSAQWFRLPVTLYLGGMDDRTEVATIQYQMQRADSLTTTLTTPLTTTEWIEENSSSLTLTVMEDGVYTLSVRVSDLAGNLSITKSLHFQADGTAPSLGAVKESACNTLSEQWQNGCNQPTFEWDAATDSASGVAGYEVLWLSPEISPTMAFYTTTLHYAPGLVGEGEHSLHLRTVDQVGNWSDWQEGFTFGYDTTAPTGSILIAQGEAIARSALVSVTLAYSDTSGTEQHGSVRLRNGEMAWSEWQPYQPAASWQLRGMNGEEITVAAQFQDTAGNLSEIVSDTITLNSQIAQARSDRYQLVRSTWSSATNHASSSRFIVQGSAGQLLAAIPVQSPQFRLTTGYWRTVLPGDLLPAPTRTPTPIIEEEEKHCLLSIEYGSLFTAQDQVQLQLDVSGASEMQLSTTEDFATATWQPYTTTATLNFPAAADQISLLTAFGRFRAGEKLLCNGTLSSNSTLYDPLPPEVALELVDVETNNNLREPNRMPDTVRISANDQADGSGVSEMQVSSNADFSNADWQAFAELIPLPLDHWSKLYVRVSDNAGNKSNVVELVNVVDYQIFLPIVKR